MPSWGVYVLLRSAEGEAFEFRYEAGNWIPGFWWPISYAILTLRSDKLACDALPPWEDERIYPLPVDDLFDD